MRALILEMEECV